MASAGDVTRGTAPGRLDLLGGVADYAGALVLEVPTMATTRVTAHAADAFEVGDVRLTCRELGALAELPLESAREVLDTLPRWSRYMIGVALLLVHRGIIDPPAVHVSVESDVPIAQGVASSAALEVATARALVPDGRLGPVEMALLCQEVENRILGVPCGIMDQAASSAGTAGAVLPILCRPVQVGAHVGLPDGVEVVGWPSGATHDVGGAPYRRARTASFMGRRIAEAASGRRVRWTSELAADAVARLPDEVLGSEFQDRFGRVDDPLSTVEPDVTYPVRAATRFGVEEHLRTRAALVSLRRGAAPELGPLLLASHHAYDAMGLGHPATDRITTEATRRTGVYGARISGGGCGGTVVVLCDRGALDDVPELIR
jgi:galactokinase